MEHFHRKKRKPTAIWAHDDQMALGIMRKCAELGIHVPNDVSVMGIDDIPTASMVYPGLTTIAQPIDAICERAVDILLNREKYVSLIHKRTVYEPRLVIRESTRSLKEE
jgi:DNA-binding LacI/PurR family transcriptional regulator